MPIPREDVGTFCFKSGWRSLADLASHRNTLRTGPMSAVGQTRSFGDVAQCLTYRRERTSSLHHLRSQKCHVWTAPSWQELSSRLQHWSAQPCVRPLDAVHMTAGHNALRGSGPGQKPAFDNNAMAQVGCPDRRIDRLCITRCSLLQPSHHAGCPARSRFTPQARRVACNARP
jgi:hypothetical protein